MLESEADGMTTVFPWPTMLIDASILMVMGVTVASAAPSSSSQSTSLNVSSLIGTAAFVEYGGGGAVVEGEEEDRFRRSASTSASLRYW